MQTKEKRDIELLLSMLEKEQLCEFIRQECAYDKGFLQRFLALGAGILYAPKVTDYVYRIHDIIEKFSGRSGYVEYYQGFEFNHAVCQILHEVNAAMSSQKWEVAIAILEGVAITGDDIMYCGDDSGGELSSIIDECFEKWQELCSNELLPPKIKSKIFELSITYFMEECLGGWDWWWSWIDIAISVSDTAEQRERLINVLDDVINEQGAKWSDDYKRNKAKRYKLEVMSISGTPEEQRKFMYDNVSVPEFRKRLLQIAWDDGNYKEVLRLAQEGVIHDSKLAGLVRDWHKWELKTYRHNNDNEKTAELSRYFFFHEGMYGDEEYGLENMYALMKSTVAAEKWNDYVETLIKEAQKKKDEERILYIYKQEKMMGQIHRIPEENSFCV